MRPISASIRMDVFGRDVLVQRIDDAWQAFYPGAEGKKRAADDISIPQNLSIDEIPDYVADLCHEWASPQHDKVRVLG